MQIQTLVAFSQHLKIFEDVREPLSGATHFQCCQSMTYQHCATGNFLFHEGDPADSFYVVLAGSCAVLRCSGEREWEQLCVVRPGEGLGELALLSGKPRAASVFCREDCHFAVLSHENYTQVLARAHEELLREKVSLLSVHPVFRKWTNTAVRRLSCLFKIKTLHRKEQLFQASRPVTEVYFVKSGDFHLTQGLRVAGKLCSVKVSAVGAGEVLGLEGLQDRPHAYSCVCASSLAQVMFISKEDFRKALNEEAFHYFLSLDKAKEQHRSTHMDSVLRIQEERHTMAPLPLQSNHALRPSHHRTYSLPLILPDSRPVSPSESALKQQLNSLRPHSSYKRSLGRSN